MALAAVTTLAHAAWQHAHGDSANTGFEMIDTAPARWSQTQLLGSIAPGANPVVGPNGDVYVGNLEGELRAFHADGTPYWTRKINSLQGGFFAAPVVGADGSIYAVSSVHSATASSQRAQRFFSAKFAPGGSSSLEAFPGAVFRSTYDQEPRRDHGAAEHLALERDRGDHRARCVQIACCQRPAPDCFFDQRSRARR
jgi:outer membrane protein assembly factor BamB